MRLPEISPGGDVPSAAPEARQAGAAAAGLGDVMQRGMTAIGQEIVKTQTQDAHLEFSQKLDALKEEALTRKSMPVDEAKARLGDQYDSIPQELRMRAETPVPALDQNGQPMRDATTGEVQQKPRGFAMFDIGDALVGIEGHKALQDASQHISASPWQAPFQRAAMGDLIQQRSHVQQAMLQQRAQDLADTQTKNAMAYAFSGNFEMAHAVVDGSLEALGVKGQRDLGIHVSGIEQMKPINDALIQFRSNPTAPNAKADLQAAAVRLADDKTMWAVDPGHRAAMDRSVRAALDKADRLDNGGQVKAQGRLEFDRVMKEANGDPARALQLAEQIENTPIHDETQRRIKERMGLEHEVRTVEDSPRIGRLETVIAQSGAIDRSSSDYALLSDEGRARVEARWDARRREITAEGRRQQGEQDRTNLDDFKSRSVKEQATMDVGAAYPRAGELGLAQLRAAQRKASLEWQRDQGVSQQAFVQRARAVADALKIAGDEKKSTTARGRFMDVLRSERDDWFQANPDKRAMPADVVDGIFKRNLQVINPGFFSSNIPRWKQTVTGVGGEPTKEQPQVDVYNRLHPPEAAPAAAAGPRGSYKVGAQVPSEALGWDAGATMELQANGKWKRIK